MIFFGLPGGLLLGGHDLTEDVVTLNVAAAAVVFWSLEAGRLFGLGLDHFSAEWRGFAKVGAFELDLTDVSLALIFFLVRVEDENEKLDRVAVDQVLVHLLVLFVRLFGDHGERCREKVDVESLRVRAKTLVDAFRELLELLHVLREEAVLLALNIVRFDGCL